MVYQPDDADTVLADAESLAFVAGGSPVRCWLEEFTDLPAGEEGARFETSRHVLRVKPGALGTVAIDQLVTVDGVEYRYLGEAPHTPTIFEQLLLVRNIP